MRNIRAVAYAIHRVARTLNRHNDLDRAIACWSPVGYCAGVQGAGERPAFFYGGDAVLHTTKATEKTIFRVASISKIICAAAVLRLARQKKLALDCDIHDVLGIPIQKTITPRQLLTHTAGISDEHYNAAIECGVLPPLGELLSVSHMRYTPGTRFRYSNFSAGIAGMLVEKASGMLYDEYIRQQFFAQHGMDASFHPQRILHKENIANCYRVPGRSISYDANAVARQPLDTSANPEKHYTVPAGCLLITAPDLLTLMRLLPRMEPELFTLQNKTGSVQCNTNRGLGVALAKKGIFSATRSFYGHQGTAYGAVCQAWVDLSDGLCAVFLTNGARLSAGSPLQRVGQQGISVLVKGK